MVNSQFWVLQKVCNDPYEIPYILEEGVYKIKIGREKDCHIICDMMSVSKYHCEIIVDNNKVYIKDCGSTNGTFIEQSMILKGDLFPLNHGTFISFGRPFYGGELPLDHLVFKLTTCRLFTSEVAENIEKTTGSISYDISPASELGFTGFNFDEMYNSKVKSKIHRIKHGVSLFQCT